MKTIVCIDERGGISFLGRRLSRDAAVVEDIIKAAGDSRVFISPYSLPLFQKWKTEVTEEPLRFVGDGDYYFAEIDCIEPLLESSDGLIIYNWNRHYPSDRRFTLDPAELGFRLTETSEFEGKSHKKITKEIYTK